MTTLNLINRTVATLAPKSSSYHRAVESTATKNATYNRQDPTPLTHEELVELVNAGKITANQAIEIERTQFIKAHGLTNENMESIDEFYFTVPCETYEKAYTAYKEAKIYENMTNDKNLLKECCSEIRENWRELGYIGKVDESIVKDHGRELLEEMAWREAYGF